MARSDGVINSKEDLRKECLRIRGRFLLWRILVSVWFGLQLTVGFFGMVVFERFSVWWLLITGVSAACLFSIPSDDTLEQAQDNLLATFEERALNLAEVKSSMDRPKAYLASLPGEQEETVGQSEQ